MFARQSGNLRDSMKEDWGWKQVRQRRDHEGLKACGAERRRCLLKNFKTKRTGVFQR